MVWQLHPDRAFPAEATTRQIAREIHAQVADLPIVGMHGHVEVGTLADDASFGDATDIFVRPDHYLFRMLVSQGAPLELFREDGGSSRDLWRLFCENWRLFRGTPTRYWLQHVFVEVLGLDEEPSASSADQLFDRIGALLATPEYRPSALFDRFGIEILATTDAANDSLDDHARLAAGPLAGRVVPTFRPDALVRVHRAGWPAEADALAAVAGIDTGDYAGFLGALRVQRQRFLRAGARATDHAVVAPDTTPLDPADAARVFALARRGEASEREAEAFAGHMLFEFARMSAEDGLTMQLHPGVLRDYDSAVFDRFGTDVGYDIPVDTEFTRALRPLLNAFGHHPGMRLIVFTVDETTFSRELAPLAGVYPAMRLGAPWWFLDSPDGLRRFREAITDTAGFYNTSGFVDDTRAFMSIPARHELVRRMDAGYLARLVAEHRLGLDEAVETAHDLAYRLPLESYPIPSDASRRG